MVVENQLPPPTSQLNGGVKFEDDVPLTALEKKLTNDKLMQHTIVLTTLAIRKKSYKDESIDMQMILNIEKSFNDQKN